MSLVLGLADCCFVIANVSHVGVVLVDVVFVWNLIETAIPEVDVGFWMRALVLQ